MKTRIQCAPAAAALLLCFGAAGCRQDRAAPTEDRAQAERPSAAPPAPLESTPPAIPSAAAASSGSGSAANPLSQAIMANLEDASIAEVFEVLRQASAQSVNVEPDAQSIADCVDITLHNPDKITIAVLADQIARAIRPSGLILERAPGGWKVRRAQDAPRNIRCHAGPASSADAPKPGDSPLITEVAAGIRAPTATSFDVTEPTRRLIFAKQDELTRSVRWISEREGDTQLGVRVFGVRPASLLGRLGIENGDRIVQVGDTRLDSKKNEAKAALALHKLTRLTVQINRRGKPLTLEYRVVPR